MFRRTGTAPSVLAPDDVDGRALLVAGLADAVRTPLGPLFDDSSLVALDRHDRLDELHLRAAGGAGGASPRGPGARATWSCATCPRAIRSGPGRRHWPVASSTSGSPATSPARSTSWPGAGRGRSRPVRRGGLQDEPADAGERSPVPTDYARGPLGGAMCEHHYPLQALLYARGTPALSSPESPGTDPPWWRAAYLFVRGMTGPGSATTERIPTGCSPGSSPRVSWTTPVRSSTAHRSEQHGDGGGRASDGWSTEAADAVLAAWVDAGVLGDLEVHLVSAVLRLAPDRPDDAVLLALALAARATRGSATSAWTSRRPTTSSWPPRRRRARVPFWACPTPGPGGRLAVSSVVTRTAGDPPPDGDDPLRPLVLDGDRVYLQRFWRFEVAVAGDCIGGQTGAPPSASPTRRGRRRPTGPDRGVRRRTPRRGRNGRPPVRGGGARPAAVPCR